MKMKLYLVGSAVAVLILAFAYQGVVRALKAAVVVAVVFMAFKGYRAAVKWRKHRQAKLE